MSGSRRVDGRRLLHGCRGRSWLVEFVDDDVDLLAGLRLSGLQGLKTLRQLLHDLEHLFQSLGELVNHLAHVWRSARVLRGTLRRTLRSTRRHTLGRITLRRHTLGRIARRHTLRRSRIGVALRRHALRRRSVGIALGLHLLRHIARHR